LKKGEACDKLASSAMGSETMQPRKKRRRLRRKNKKPNYFLRTLFLVIIAIVAVYFFLQSAFFNIKYITVSGNKQLSATNIIDLSGLKAGSNIFHLDFKPALASLTTNSLIAEAKILKEYPSKLEIQITERKAVALVPSQNGMMYVDKDGIAINERRELTSLDLPVVSGLVIPAQFPLGKKIESADLALGLDVVKQLDEGLRNRISEINIKNNYITFFLVDKAEVRIGEPDRLKEKLVLFDNIIKEENKKKVAQRIQYIDVSFEGAPVIKYKDKW
jgi:cell division protein FtsQ